MIDTKDFPLKYICRETKVVFPARVIGCSHIAVIENGEKVVYTIAKARKKYRPCKGNRSAAAKAPHVRLHISRGGMVHSKAYQEYLGETEEKLVSSFY